MPARLIPVLRTCHSSKERAVTGDLSLLKRIADSFAGPARVRRASVTCVTLAG
jgi:hypothetical protein